MSALDLAAISTNALVGGFLIWIHGYGRGMRAERRTVIDSLRFGASLRRGGRFPSDRATGAADALDAAADRIEQWR